MCDKLIWWWGKRPRYRSAVIVDSQGNLGLPPQGTSTFYQGSSTQPGGQSSFQYPAPYPTQYPAPYPNPYRPPLSCSSQTEPAPCKTQTDTDAATKAPKKIPKAKTVRTEESEEDEEEDEPPKKPKVKKPESTDKIEPSKPIQGYSPGFSSGYRCIPPMGMYPRCNVPSSYPNTQTYPSSSSGMFSSSNYGYCPSFEAPTQQQRSFMNQCPAYTQMSSSAYPQAQHFCPGMPQPSPPSNFAYPARQEPSPTRNIACISFDDLKKLTSFCPALTDSLRCPALRTESSKPTYSGLSHSSPRPETKKESDKPAPKIICLTIEPSGNIKRSDTNCPGLQNITHMKSISESPSSRPPELRGAESYKTCPATEQYNNLYPSYGYSKYSCCPCPQEHSGRRGISDSPPNQFPRYDSFPRPASSQVGSPSGQFDSKLKGKDTKEVASQCPAFIGPSASPTQIATPSNKNSNVINASASPLRMPSPGDYRYDNINTCPTFNQMGTHLQPMQGNYGYCPGFRDSTPMPPSAAWRSNPEVQTSRYPQPSPVQTDVCPTAINASKFSSSPYENPQASSTFMPSSTAWRNVPEVQTARYTEPSPVQRDVCPAAINASKFSSSRYENPQASSTFMPPSTAWRNHPEVQTARYNEPSPVQRDVCPAARNASKVPSSGYEDPQASSTIVPPCKYCEVMSNVLTIVERYKERNEKPDQVCPGAETRASVQEEATCKLMHCPGHQSTGIKKEDSTGTVKEDNTCKLMNCPAHQITGMKEEASTATVKEDNICKLMHCPSYQSSGITKEDSNLIVKQCPINQASESMKDCKLKQCPGHEGVVKKSSE